MFKIYDINKKILMRIQLKQVKMTNRNNFKKL